MKKKTTTRKTKPTKKYRSSLKKKFLFWQRGEIALYLLLIIIIGGAFLIASGGPVFNLSQPDESPVGEPIIVTPTGHDTLQLQTLKFQVCGNTTGAYFIVDTSGSMRNNNKMENVKEALTSFAGNLSDKSVIGLRRFSSDEACPIYGRQPTSLLVPIGFYSTNKNAFTQAVGRLCPAGATNTRAAFAGALTDLQAGVTKPEYKDTPLNVIFISDGIPEGDGDGVPNNLSTCSSFTSARYPVCAPYAGPAGLQCRCFDSTQDPTTNPQLAQQVQALKNINGKPVKVFSVLVYDPATDGPFLNKLNGMMESVASTPSNYYKTAKPEDIKNIYNQIADKICASNGGGATPTP